MLSLSLRMRAENDVQLQSRGQGSLKILEWASEHLMEFSLKYGAYSSSVLRALCHGCHYPKVVDDTVLNTKPAAFGS